MTTTVHAEITPDCSAQRPSRIAGGDALGGLR